MLINIVKFELRYWFRQPTVYIFLFINALLIFGASSSDQVVIGGGAGNVFKNAPFQVEFFYSVMSIMSLLMITAFMNSAAARDFSEKTSQLIFTTPIKKFDFLIGRFIGATIIALIPFLGISIGNIIGVMMPYLDASKVGPTIWHGHYHGFFVFAVPNIFFAGSIIFCIAALTKSTVNSFVGSIILLVGYIISQNLISNIDNEVIGAMLDPFGIRTFSVLTKYWTVNDRNTLSAGFEGLLLMNRIIWVSVGVLVLTYTYYKFSFSEKATSKKSKRNFGNQELVNIISTDVIATLKPEFTSGLSFKQFLSQIRIETISILKNASFMIVLLVGIINLFGGLSSVTNAGYGNTTFPVTYAVIQTLDGSLMIFLIAIITFYTGTIIWKERDAKVNDIYDSLPYSNWIPYLSKLVAMWLVMEVILLIAVCVGIITQKMYGFNDIHYSQYFIEIICLRGSWIFSLIALSMGIHVLINNRYIGYFVFIGFLIFNLFMWPVFNVSSNMVSFGDSPNMTYSDMNHYGPYVSGQFWFNLYWSLFSVLLIVKGLVYFVRGRDTDFAIRMKTAIHRFKTEYKTVFFATLFAWLLCGGFVYYNTKVLNKIVSADEGKKLRADYEKKYKKYENYNQPRITDIHYSIDLFPEDRKLHVKAEQWIKNIGKTPIDSVFYSMTDPFIGEVIISNAKLLLDDKASHFRIYKLQNPLLPNDSILISLTSDYAPKGFENEVAVTAIVQNGTFFNNAEVLPQIGYQADSELDNKNDRKEQGLKEKDRMPQLTRNCSDECMNTYISNNSDWVNVSTDFTTSSDQIAIAPGSLINKKVNGSRTTYSYKLDHFALNFYSFMSASFQVERKKWNDIDLEVYYIPEHKYNVKKMISSLENSLSYYTEHFGPYYNKQARIIEFPQYASFAQAFPGTMPYSEGIGFIANLEDSAAIDMVYYVVAHEMGHQWWAHQVTGANMQGATLLSETMAQYSALMVMEKMYGKKMMYKFLKYEMDNYLRSRGSETVKESPLIRVENQGYIHYRKGSVVMYYLKEMIGEKAINAALKDMVDSLAYRQPPYPNAYMLVDRFNAVTPDSLKYLIKDLFYDITLFGNRTTSASCQKLKNGKYEISFEIEAAKFKADSSGKETEVKINDWIEIGVRAESTNGEKIGKQLYSQMVKIDRKKSSYKVIVNERPYEAGIDPNFMLIDRVPGDNLKKVDMMD